MKTFRVTYKREVTFTRTILDFDSTNARAQFYQRLLEGRKGTTQNPDFIEYQGPIYDMVLGEE